MVWKVSFTIRGPHGWFLIAQWHIRIICGCFFRGGDGSAKKIVRVVAVQTFWQWKFETIKERRSHE